MSNYGFSKVVNTSYEDAVTRVKEELGKEGFGVLTEIDVKQTLHNKIGKDFNKYVILGACNPNFAYESLSMEEELGLLLPCNVIVYESNAGETVVAAIDPEKALLTTGNTDLAQVAGEVSEHIHKVIESVQVTRIKYFVLGWQRSEV